MDEKDIVDRHLRKWSVEVWKDAGGVWHTRLTCRIDPLHAIAPTEADAIAQAQDVLISCGLIEASPKEEVDAYYRYAQRERQARGEKVHV